MLFATGTRRIRIKVLSVAILLFLGWLGYVTGTSSVSSPSTSSLYPSSPCTT